MTRVILTDEQFRQLVWDYNLTKEQFVDILERDNIDRVWLSRNWAIARVLEGLNFYDAMRIVPRDTLVSQWPDIARRIFNKTIRDGYDYFIHRHPIPITG